MILHTVARCITDPPCEWTGTTDKSAEKHTKETGHATVSETIPVRGDGAGNGTIGGPNEAAPGGVCAPFSEGLTPSKEGLMSESSAHPAGGHR